MRLLLIISALMFSGCSDAVENNNAETCDITFKNIGTCSYKDIAVSVDAKILSSDEKLLRRLNVIKSGDKFALNIINDTTILDGDKGYISFKDINFDNVPDIAITTSFGLANLFMDYWVYDTIKNKYTYIGNYAKFEINLKNKTLANIVKVSAAKYKNTKYSWNGLKLVELKN